MRLSRVLLPMRRKLPSIAPQIVTLFIVVCIILHTASYACIHSVNQLKTLAQADATLRQRIIAQVDAKVPAERMLGSMLIGLMGYNTMRDNAMGEMGKIDG